MISYYEDYGVFYDDETGLLFEEDGAVVTENPNGEGLVYTGEVLSEDYWAHIAQVAQAQEAATGDDVMTDDEITDVLAEATVDSEFTTAVAHLLEKKGVEDFDQLGPQAQHRFAHEAAALATTMGNEGQTPEAADSDRDAKRDYLKWRLDRQGDFTLEELQQMAADKDLQYQDLAKDAQRWQAGNRNRGLLHQTRDSMDAAMADMRVALQADKNRRAEEAGDLDHLSPNNETMAMMDRIADSLSK